MEITPHVEAIRAALEAVAGDDEASAAVADRLSHAVAPAVQLQLLDLLGQVALEVTSQLPSGRVDLQLAGRDALLVFTDSSPAASSAAAPDDDSGTARLTLRMSDALKAAVEQTAAQEGLSTNAWLVNAAKRALEPAPSRRRGPGPGNRLSGYTQA
jgi:hypothetical protein